MSRIFVQRYISPYLHINYIIIFILPNVVTALCYLQIAILYIMLIMYICSMSVVDILFLDYRPDHNQHPHRPNGPSEKWAASLRKRDPELLPAIHSRRDR